MFEKHFKGLACQRFDSESQSTRILVAINRAIEINFEGLKRARKRGKLVAGVRVYNNSLHSSLRYAMPAEFHAKGGMK